MWCHERRLPVLQVRVRRDRGRRRARDRHDAGLPRHQPAGADARAGDPEGPPRRRSPTWPPRRPPWWPTWSAAAARWPSRRGWARATALVFNTGAAGGADASSTCTGTCSAAARWPGRPAEPATARARALGALPYHGACPTRALTRTDAGGRPTGPYMTETTNRRDQPQHIVDVPNSINMVALLGPNDEHLALIEAGFDADIHVRGNASRCAASPHELALAERLHRRARRDPAHRSGAHPRDRRARDRHAARRDAGAARPTC